MTTKETLLLVIANLTDVECERLLTYLDNSKAVRKVETLGDRKDKFETSIHQMGILNNEYSYDLVNEFYQYWSEHNDNGKKMRFEMSKNQPFNIKRRLATWKKNNKNWNSNQQKPMSLADKMKQQHGL